MTEEQHKALDERLEAIGNTLGQVAKGITGLHTSAAETRRDIRSLDQKLARVQEALYYIGFKILHPSESEELRSMLPDPPERLSSVGR
jgi:archaellum component FlaC